MEALDVLGLLVIGFCAGMLGGLVGVGGGVLFVPGLVFFMGLSQLDALSTSLVAVVFVAVVGAWRQYGYGNVRVRDGLIVGPGHPLRILETDEGPSPRVAVRFGLEAELTRPLYYELAEIALAEGHNPPGVWSDGVFFSLS